MNATDVVVVGWGEGGLVCDLHKPCGHNALSVLGLILKSY